MKRFALLSLTLAILAQPNVASAQAAAAQSKGIVKPDLRAPSEIVATAPAADWVAIAVKDLLVMELAPDGKGKPRRVVIQLMPPPFSQGWIGNIRKLAAAHWWDGTSVNRVQDNYVAQWGDATEKKVLPQGLSRMVEDDYHTTAKVFLRELLGTSRLSKIMKQLATEPAGPATNAELVQMLTVDPYATRTSFAEGWPAGFEGADLTSRIWPIHCYGMVGVGRGLSPDTGSGTELYTVIGHAPRHLDRNIALVGRVIEGIEHLSSLPRGTEGLGFYKSAEERVPILRVRLATELPAADQPRFEYLSTESASFVKYADARANRRDPFFIRPAGGADICNIPVPVRRVKG